MTELETSRFDLERLNVVLRRTPDLRLTQVERGGGRANPSSLDRFESSEVFKKSSKAMSLKSRNEPYKTNLMDAFLLS